MIFMHILDQIGTQLVSLEVDQDCIKNITYMEINSSTFWEDFHQQLNQEIYGLISQKILRGMNERTNN